METSKKSLLKPVLIAGAVVVVGLIGLFSFTSFQVPKSLYSDSIKPTPNTGVEAGTNPVAPTNADELVKKIQEQQAKDVQKSSPEKGE